MDKEIAIVRFRYSYLGGFTFTEELVGLFYSRTGNKISIHYNGSKGYLDNIEFVCEGDAQVYGANRIDCSDLFKSDGHLSRKEVTLYWSRSKGIRIGQPAKDKEGGV